MGNRLQAFFRIRSSEVTVTVIMFLYIFGILSFHYILKPLRASFFLQSQPASNLPYAYLLTALFAGSVATLVFRLGRRIPLISLIRFTNLAIILSLFGFMWALSRDFNALPYVYYVYVQTISALATTQFWLLAGSVYDARQAKRTYGFLGVGAIAGAIAGSFVPSFLSERLTPETMLLICVAIAGGLIVLSQLAWRHRRQIGRSESRGRDPDRDRFGGLCRVVGSSRHLRLIAALVFLTIVGSQLAEWQLNQAVQSHYAALDQIEQGQRINEFFGRFYLVTNVLGMLIQVFAAGMIVSQAGILAALLVLPFGLLLGGLGVFLVPGLVTATLARGNDAAFRHSLSRTSLELLYLPLSPMIRERLKVFVDVFVDRAGRALAGAVILLLTSGYLSVGLRGTALVIVALMGACILIAFRVRRSYVDEFREQLERSEVDLSEVASFVTDPASVQMLIGTLNNSDERRVRYALKLLQSTRGVDFSDQLLPLMSHPSDRVRTEALRTLPALDGDFSEVARGLLADPDNGVRFAAIDYLLTARDVDTVVVLHSMLDHEDSRIRMDAARWAAEHAPSEFRAPRQVVDELLGQQDRNGPAAGARLALRLEPDEARRVLAALLDSSDPEVAGTAASSAARLGDLEVSQRVIQMLTESSLRKYAKAALVDYGHTLAPELASVLGDPSADIAVRREIPWVLSRIGGESCARTLTENLSAEDWILRYRVVKGLNHLRETEPTVSVQTAAVARQLRLETKRYYEALALAMPFDEHEGLLGRAIRERLDRDLELIFRLLGLEYPQKDIYSAYKGLRSAQRDRRVAALELIDNVLRADLKSIILPLLEEGSSEEVASRARDHFGIRERGLEESLKRVLEEPDNWLRACALYEIGRRNLTDMSDICRSLTRDGDAVVRESASWALGRLDSGFHQAAPVS